MRNLNLSMGLNICQKSNPKPLKIDKKQMSGIKDAEKFLLKPSRNRCDHFGYIDVGDGCWRRNVLVTTMRCW